MTISIRYDEINKVYERSDKAQEAWARTINEKKTEIGKIQSINTSKANEKMTIETDDVTISDVIKEDNMETTGFSAIGKDIFRLIKNSKSVYCNSKEEPLMIYYNNENELLAFEINDVEKAEQFRKWLRKKTNRFQNEMGNCVINMKLNNLIITNSKEKNMVKIIIVLHKTEFSPMGMEMINKSTARIKFRNKVEANKYLNFFEVHNKLVSVYIDNREIMYKGIVSDWPKGIPELFDALDSRDNIIKMERMKKRVWNKENNSSNTIASDNITITFRGKEIIDYEHL